MFGGRPLRQLLLILEIGRMPRCSFRPQLRPPGANDVGSGLCISITARRHERYVIAARPKEALNLQTR